MVSARSRRRRVDLGAGAGRAGTVPTSVVPRQALHLRAPRCRLAHDTPVDNCYPSRMP
jgi:hypothetical protein